MKKIVFAIIIVILVSCEKEFVELDDPLPSVSVDVDKLIEDSVRVKMVLSFDIWSLPDDSVELLNQDLIRNIRLDSGRVFTDMEEVSSDLYSVSKSKKFSVNSLSVAYSLWDGVESRRNNFSIGLKNPEIKHIVSFSYLDEYSSSGDFSLDYSESNLVRLTVFL